MKAEVTFYATKAAVATVKTDTRQRCEHALKMLLTQHGDPFIEVEQILADDPGCVFGIVYVPHSSFAMTTPPSDP